MSDFPYPYSLLFKGFYVAEFIAKVVFLTLSNITIIVMICRITIIGKHC
jgi:hypothetical protein